MFKKLREKIVEEVRQSPIRFPGNDPFQAVSLGADVAKTENQGPKPEQFSITDDDGASSELGSPYKEQNNAAVIEQTTEKASDMAQTSSHENDHFLFQYEAPQWPKYVPQSDIESEIDEGQTSGLDGVSKEQLYVAAQKLHARLQKYKTKYTEVVKAYKEINEENEKIKRALTESQDKALRRMTELREQCSLEQQAKAHLEQNLRVMLEEKDEMIGVLETKIRFLKEGNSASDTGSESNKDIAIVDNLVDLGTSSPDSQAADLQEMQKKVKRLEELLGRCKETLRSNKERSTLLMQERDHLASQLEQKEKEILQVQEKELEVQARLRGELSEVHEQMKRLEKQQEESVMAMAETKQNMHQELESREQQLAQVKQKLQTLQDEKESLANKVQEKESEIEKIKDDREKATKEMEDRLKRTETTLEEEKQSLMQELARGKTAAIALVQEESAKKLELQEQEWKNRLKEAEEIDLRNEKALEETRTHFRQQLEELEKTLKDTREKKAKLKNELAEVRALHQKQMEETKMQLQQHQKDVAIMKHRQEENMQRSEQEKNAISQIEEKLQTLLGEKDKELSRLSTAKDNLDQHVNEYYHKTESLTHSIKELQKERDGLTTELQEVKSEAERRESELQQALDELEKKMTKTGKDLEDVLEERNALLKQVEALQASSSSYSEIKTQLDDATKESSEKLRMEREAMGNLEAELILLKENNEEIRKEMEQKKLEVDEKDNKISELSQLVVSLKESRAFLLSSGSNLLQTVSLLREELDSVKNLSSKFQNEVNEQFSALYDTAKDITLESNTRRKSIEELKSLNLVLENETKEGKAENEHLRLNLEAMEKEKNHFQKMEEKWELDFEESKKYLKYLEENCEHYNGCLRALNEKTADLISVRHGQLENLKGVLLQLKLKLDSDRKHKEESIAQLTAENHLKENEIGSLKEQIAIMEVRSSELSTVFEEKTTWENEIKEKHKTQINELINKTQKWKAKLHQTHEQLEMQKSNFESHIEETEKENLDRKISYEEEIDSLKKSATEFSALLKVAEEQIAKQELMCHGWEEKCCDAERENRQLVKQLNELQESTHSGQDELKNKMILLERNLGQMQNELSQKQEETERLRQQLIEKDDCFKELEERLESVHSMHQEKESAFEKSKEAWEQRLKSLLEDKNRELQISEEKWHEKETEVECRLASYAKKLTEMEENLAEKELAYQELQEIKATSQQFSNEISILKEELAKKELEIQEFGAIINSKDVLVHNISLEMEKLQSSLDDLEKFRDKCNSYKKECQEKEAVISELEQNLRTLELSKALSIQELEEKLSNAVEEYERNQIRMVHLQEVIANNNTTTSQPNEKEADCWEEYERTKEEMEKELSRIRENLDDALLTKQNLEESEALLKSNCAFLKEQMNVMEASYKKKVEDLETKLELVSTQLDESLLVAEVNQASSTQEMDEIKNRLEAIQKELEEKTKQLMTLESSYTELQEMNAKLAENAANGNVPENSLLRDVEISDETRTKHQEREDQLAFETHQSRITLESKLAEKGVALDEMQDYYQQQLQEKQEEIQRLSESERNRTKTESSDWDNGWEVEPVEDELLAHDKENQKPVAEEIEDAKTKHQKEASEQHMPATDGRPSSPEINNFQEHRRSSFLEPTEYEYLRNIMLEYMMGKEPLTLAKVISAVLRFTDDQTQQILTREEAKLTSVK